MARKPIIRDLVATDALKSDGGGVLRDRQGRPRLRRIIKFGFAGGSLLLSAFLAYASIGLPFPGKVQDSNKVQASSIFARDGQTLLYKIRGEKNRTVVSFDQMPKCIKEATVAVEDKDFYKHNGFDPRGFGRALIADISSRSTSGGGGSTITQQLVKNALLSPEQTITRKARELTLSLEIEQMFAKDDILSLYLNNIPYGNNAYGIEAASQTYFGINAKDLTLAQCATLASVPRAPTFYSPYNNPDPTRLLNRSKFVLDRMVAQKYITADQSAAAKAEIDKGLQYTAARGEDITAPHFVFYVREQLERKYGVKRVEQGGLKVITTLDPGKQKVADQAIQDARGRFAGYGASNAALTSIDPKTGQILAMVGSVDFFDAANDGNVNVATSLRQPGSAMKPIFYLDAFRKGSDTIDGQKIFYNPATLLWDVKTDFGGFAPNNYDKKFRGPVAARDALQQSLNVPAVKILDLDGLERGLDFANQMGVSTMSSKDSVSRGGPVGESLILGGKEVRLVDLTTAYSVIANGGIAANTSGGKAAPASLLEVRDSKNKVLDKYKGQSKPIVDSDANKSKALAFQLTDVLKDDNARAPQFGRNSALTLPGREAGTKTGTTDSFRDAWTVGFTPSLVTGVWLGNNDNTPMNQVGGSLGAAPIWQDYMGKALAGTPNEKFTKPNDLVKQIKVDKLTGMLPTGGATKTEWFVEGVNAPTEKSKAASSDCSTTSGKGLHSERPNDKAWEDPVQAFIRSRGITVAGSTDSNEGCKPDISIVSPAANSTVSDTIQIQAKAEAKGGGTIKQVDFAWDGILIESVEQEPYIVSYEIKDTSGKHTITAKAVDNKDNSNDTAITVTVNGEASPSPSPITISLTCTPARVCTAGSSAPLFNPVLVNADDTSQTVPMSKVATQTYQGTVPAGWTSVYAEGEDADGNKYKSSNKTLSFGSGFNLATNLRQQLAFL